MADVIATVIVDTDVISFTFKGDTRAALYAPHLANKLTYISFQTRAELEQWAIARQWGARRHAALLEFIEERFAVIESSSQLCRPWAEVREQVKQAGHLIQPSDAWIAATAVLYGVPLVTHNADDFAQVQNLSVISEA
jgi:tRNA(fMet)-specific endonuclease VapC